MPNWTKIPQRVIFVNFVLFRLFIFIYLNLIILT